MNEMTNGTGQGQDTQVSQPAITSSAQDVQGTPAKSADERLFKQSEVNEIVGRAKREAEEKVSRLTTQQPEYAQRKYSDTSQQAHSQDNVPNDNHYRQIAAEEVQRLRDQWVQEARSKSEADQAQRIVNNFWNKIAPGREKYQDFEKVTGDIEYRNFTNTVQLLAEYVDNPHDVLYELGKDRLKLSQLETLAERSPRDAVVQAQRLAQSIKDNESASKTTLPRAPLSQMRPSNTGTDNGVMSVSDLRKKYIG